MADEEELLRQAEVLAAVGQEERDGDGEPHRHGGNGQADLEDLGGLRIYDTIYWIHLRSIYREVQLKFTPEKVFIKVNR